MGECSYATGKKATLGIRPQQLRPVPDGTGPLNGTVVLTERLGSETIVDVRLNSNDSIVAALPEDTILRPGDAVSFDFDPAHAHLFDETL